MNGEKNTVRYCSLFYDFGIRFLPSRTAAIPQNSPKRAPAMMHSTVSGNRNEVARVNRPTNASTPHGPSSVIHDSIALM